MSIKKDFWISLNFTNIPLKQCNLKSEILDIFSSDKSSSFIKNHRPFISFPKPVLAKLENTGYSILYGPKNLEPLIKNGIEEIPAFVISGDTSMLDIFTIIAYYHRQHENFSHVEISRFLHVLKHNDFPDSDLIIMILPSLGISPTQNFLKEYLSIKNIIPDLAEVLNRKRAPLKTWLLFTEMSEEEQLFFVDFAVTLKPSLSILNEIVKSIIEISIRDDIKPEEVIHRNDLRKFLSEENVSEKSSLDDLRMIIFQSRYPILASHHHKIENAVNNINFPEQVSVSYDKTFEKKEINLLCRISCSDDFEKLKRFFSTEDFDKLKDIQEHL